MGRLMWVLGLGGNHLLTSRPNFSWSPSSVNPWLNGKQRRRQQQQQGEERTRSENIFSCKKISSAIVGGWTNPIEKYESNWKSSPTSQFSHGFFVINRFAVEKWRELKQLLMGWMLGLEVENICCQSDSKTFTNLNPDFQEILCKQLLMWWCSKTTWNLLLDFFPPSFPQQMASCVTSSDFMITPQMTSVETWAQESVDISRFQDLSLIRKLAFHPGITISDPCLG